jgi:hypothetical protein
VTLRLLPEVLTLPSRMWLTESARAIVGRSFPSRAARNAEALAATRIPGTRTSAFMISSAIPSQRYSWSFAGLRSSKGRTAIATNPASGRIAPGAENAGLVVSWPRPDGATVMVNDASCRSSFSSLYTSRDVW